MLDFLFDTGYLINQYAPGLADSQIVALNRLAKLLQLVSAVVIIIEIAGTAPVMSIVVFLSWPFRKIRELMWTWVEGEKPPDSSFRPLVGPWVISLALLFAWHLWSARPLGYWLLYPFGIFATMVSTVTDADWRAPASFLWALLVAVVYFYWGLLSAMLFVVSPVLTLAGTIGIITGHLVKGQISIDAFRLFFFAVFLLGWLLEFVTSK